jgi:hypothetical protein
MTRFRTMFALALACALTLPQAALAGAPGSWTPISPTISSSLSQSSLVRRANGGLVAQWGHSGSPDVLESRRISSAGAAEPLITTTLAPSAAITNPGLLYTPGTDCTESWIGAETGGAYNGGLYRSQLWPSASDWSVSSTNLINNAVSEAYASNNVSVDWSATNSRVFATWDQAGYVYSLRSDGVTQAGQTLLEGGPNANYPNVACDPAGTSVLASWASISSTVPGVKIAAINPSTGAPISTWTLPGSATTYYGAPSFDIMMQRTPMCAVAGNGFVVGYPVGYPTRKTVVLWHATTAGADGSIAVAGGSSKKDAVTVSAEGTSTRLWVTWAEMSGSKPVIRARRSDAAGNAFGAVVTLAVPSGVSRVVNASADAQSGKLDVVALLQNASGYQQYHTQILPGMTVSASPTSLKRKAKKTVRIRVLDVKSPVAGAVVKFGKKKAKTNSNGYATFKAGPYKQKQTVKISVSRTGYTATSLSFKIK